MNTTKQVNIMILVVFLSVLATGIYWIWDPRRAEDAEGTQLQATMDRGAWLFSQNCRTCHGNAGEGGAASNRLRVAPALNRPDLQGKPGDSEEIDDTAKSLAFRTVYNTIECGRIGKAMPTWGQRQGGTLNDEQMRQLTVFITEGTDWELANEFALEGVPAFDLHGDTYDNVRLVNAISAEDTTFQVTNFDKVSKGIRLQIEDEIMVIEDVETVEKGVTVGAVTVERGIGTTNAVEHEADSLALKPPVPPDPAPITQPACGQNLPAAVNTPPPEAPSTTLSIVAEGIAWNKTLLSAVAGEPLTLTLDNRDDGTAHNIHFQLGAEPGGETVFASELATGPNTETLNFGPLDAGAYYYLCDVHPAMEGVLTAYAPGTGPGGAGAPAAGETPAADTTAEPADTAEAEATATP